MMILELESFDIIELAHNVIAGAHRLIIQLLRDIDSRRSPGIVFIWPPALTVIEPSKLATVTTASALHCFSSGTPNASG